MPQGSMTWHGEKLPPSGAGRPGQQRAAAREGLSSFSSPPLGLPAALPAADLRPLGGEREGGWRGWRREGGALNWKREGEASELFDQRRVLWSKQIQRGERHTGPHPSIHHSRDQAFLFRSLQVVHQSRTS